MAVVIDAQGNKIIVNNLEVVKESGVDSNNVEITPYGTVTATDLQGAIEQLADQAFRTTTTPTGHVDQGDTWYNPDTEQLYVYRETTPGGFQWVPIMIGNFGDTSDQVDGGAF